MAGLSACLNTPDVPPSLQRCAHEGGKYFKIYFFGGGGKYIYFFHVLWNTLETFRENAFKSLFLVKD